MKSWLPPKYELSRGTVPQAAEVCDAHALIALLKGLIDDPSRLSGDSAGTLPGGFERWEDQDNVYLEAELSGGSDIALDLCIQGGRVFIRMEK